MFQALDTRRSLSLLHVIVPVDNVFNVHLTKMSRILSFLLSAALFKGRTANKKGALWLGYLKLGRAIGCSEVSGLMYPPYRARETDRGLGYRKKGDDDAFPMSTQGSFRVLE